MAKAGSEGKKNNLPDESNNGPALWGELDGNVGIQVRCTFATLLLQGGGHKVPRHKAGRMRVSSGIGKHNLPIRKRSSRNCNVPRFGGWGAFSYSSKGRK